MGAISAGQEWQTTIDTRLNSADIILLLISSDFIASDYCYSKEMQRALQMHRMGQACVIPIILRSAQWKETPIGFLQALPKNGKPISTWENRDDAYFSVTEEVQERVKALLHIKPGDQLSDLPNMPALQKLPSEGSVKFNLPEYQIQVNLSTSAKIDRLENADVKTDSTESRIQEARARLLMRRRQNTNAYYQECARWSENAEKARKHGDWEEEGICWEILQDFKPYIAQARERRRIVKENQRHKHIYDEAKQYAENRDKDATKEKLLELWQNAPFYGDPAGLAWRAGLYIPLGG